MKYFESRAEKLYQRFPNTMQPNVICDYLRAMHIYTFVIS